jgi:hypothetical protein
MPDSGSQRIALALHESHFVITREPPSTLALHLDLLSFHLTNPSSFRRMFFSFVESAPRDTVLGHGFWDGGCYGHPCKIDELIPQGEKYDLIVPHAHLDSVEGAIAEVEKMMGVACGVKDQLTYVRGCVMSSTVFFGLLALNTLVLWPAVHSYAPKGFFCESWVPHTLKDELFRIAFWIVTAIAWFSIAMVVSVILMTIWNTGNTGTDYEGVLHE